MSIISNKPRILRGAFVEYGISIPPLFVAFQFNPQRLTRNRNISHLPPSAANNPSGRNPLREYHKSQKDLSDIQKNQAVSIDEETMSFEIMLDAHNLLNEGDSIAQQFGIAPQLSTLELMLHPKEESLLGALLLGESEGYSYTCKPNPPLILFIWGRKRVLPVNIQSLNINEIFYSPDLNPINATVNISLTVIEGPNAPYQYSKAMKEAMSVLNLANISDVANVIIPG